MRNPARPGERKAAPLAGVRVWNTRPAGPDAEAWNTALRSAGALVMHIPTARVICPARDTSTLDDALRTLATAAARRDSCHLLFTSPRGAEATLARLASASVPPHALEGVGIWCVGPRTAAAWAASAYVGPAVEREPAPSGAEGREGVIARLGAGLAPDALVVWPRSSLAPEAAADPLRRSGARVLAPVAYETVAGPDNEERVRQLLDARDADALVFASPSAVVGLLSCLSTPAARGRLPTIVCLGETTAEACRDVGLPVAAVAGEPSPDAIVAAVRHARSGR